MNFKLHTITTTTTKSMHMKNLKFLWQLGDKIRAKDVIYIFMQIPFIWILYIFYDFC